MPKHRRAVSELPVDFSLVQSTSTTPPASHSSAEEPSTSVDQEARPPKRTRTDTLDELQMERIASQQTPPQPLPGEDEVESPDEAFGTSFSDSEPQNSLPTTEPYSSESDDHPSEDEEDESSDSEASSQASSYPSSSSPGSSSAPPLSYSDEDDHPSEDEEDPYNSSSHFSSEHSEPPSPSESEDEWPDVDTGKSAPAAAPAALPQQAAVPASDQFFEYGPDEPRGGPEIHLYHNPNQPRVGTPRPNVAKPQWPHSNTHSFEREDDQTPPSVTNVNFQVQFLGADDPSHPSTEGASEYGPPPNEGPSWWN